MEVNSNKLNANPYVVAGKANKIKDPFGQNLDEFLRLNKVKVTQMAAETGIPKDRIYKWRKGAAPTYEDRVLVENWMNNPKWKKNPINLGGERDVSLVPTQQKQGTRSDADEDLRDKYIRVLEQYNALLQQSPEKTLERLFEKQNALLQKGLKKQLDASLGDIALRQKLLLGLLRTVLDWDVLKIMEEAKKAAKGDSKKAAALEKIETDLRLQMGKLTASNLHVVLNETMDTLLAGMNDMDSGQS